MNTRRGFTLIELMIVVAIMAILSLIAYPSYISHIQRSKQADAKATLVDIHLKLKEYFVDRKGYTVTLSNLNVYPANLGDYYTYTLTQCANANNNPITCITITATPILGSMMEGTPAIWMGTNQQRGPAAIWQK